MYGNKQIANCLLGNFILYITSEQNTEKKVYKQQQKKTLKIRLLLKTALLFFFSLIFYICVDEKSLFSSVTTLNYY